MLPLLRSKKISESFAFIVGFRLIATHIRWLAILSLLLNFSFANAKSFVKQITIAGDITIQKLGEEKSISTSDAQLTLWLGDSLYDKIVITKSGLFSFNLKVGNDYTLKCQKSGFSTKYVNFLLAEVDSNLIDEDNNNFDLSVNLIASDFLTKDVVTRIEKSDIFWDFRYNGLSYSNRQLQRRWSIIDSLSSAYQMAVKNLSPNAYVNQIASLPDSINWPRGIGSQFDIGVFGDYSLYVSLVLAKESNAAFSNNNLNYLDKQKTITDSNLDLLVLNEQSYLWDSVDNQYLKNDMLIASESNGTSVMLQLSKEADYKIHVLDELDFSNKGFSLVQTSRILADQKAEDEFEQVSQASVKDSNTQMELILALSGPEEALLLKNEALRRV